MNPYRQKKNCKRCKAVLHNSNGHIECRLGYELSMFSFDEHGLGSWGEPLEPCPKPLTYSDYLHADKHYKKPHKQLTTGAGK